MSGVRETCTDRQDKCHYSSATLECTAHRINACMEALLHVSRSERLPCRCDIHWRCPCSLSSSGQTPPHTVFLGAHDERSLPFSCVSEREDGHHVLHDPWCSVSSNQTFQNHKQQDAATQIKSQERQRTMGIVRTDVPCKAWIAPKSTCGRKLYLDAAPSPAWKVSGLVSAVQSRPRRETSGSHSSSKGACRNSDMLMDSNTTHEALFESQRAIT